jgi:hypothetical protein
MQCAWAILSTVACPAVQNISTIAARFSTGEKKPFWILTMRFEFLYNFCLKHFSFSEELRQIQSKILIGLHVECPSFLSSFNEKWFFLDIFEKYSNMKFYENLFSGSGVDSFGQTYARTDLVKLIVAFRTFTSAPNKIMLFTETAFLCSKNHTKTWMKGSERRIF